MADPTHGPERIAYLALIIAGAIAIGVLSYRDEQQRTTIHNEFADIRAVAIQVNRALCLRKDELQHSIIRDRAYLAQHPDGTPNFPRGFILHTIRDDQATLGTLTDVRCPSRE